MEKDSTGKNIRVRTKIGAAGILFHRGNQLGRTNFRLENLVLDNWNKGL